jgi:glycosyltransferase involved in cell wall biosynthesis
VEPFTRIPGHFDWFATHICGGLAGRGHQVTLVTCGGISPVYLPAVTCLRVVDAAGDSDQDFDAKTFNGKIDISSWRAFLRRKSRELRTFHRALSLLREEAFDVIQFLDGEPIMLFLALYALMKRRHAERIAILANLHQALWLTRPAGGLKARAHKALYRYALRTLVKEDLDALIVMDDLLKSELISRLELIGPAGNKVRVVPHGIDELQDLSDKEGARRRLNLSQEETIFLLFGILRKDKRIDLAIEAIKGLACCRLLIAGQGFQYDADAVEELIHKHGCENSVSTDIRHIDEDRMHDYFLASDAVMLPYAADFQGQSGILTKACAHGKCVIASAVGAVGKTVREAGIGFVVEPESAERLREAINKFLLLKAEERMQMEVNSRSLAAEQSWNSVCSQLEGVYSQILNQKRERATVGYGAARTPDQ